MNKFGRKEFIDIRFAIDSLKHEKENLYRCLKEVIATRNAIEANLDDVQNQLYSVVRETHAVQASNAINSSKIQSLDKEVAELEKQQEILSLQVKSLNESIKEHEENTDMEINDLTMKADNLCERFLAATLIEPDEESMSSKILSEINKLKAEISEKETKLNEMKKEMDEFVFYGDSENHIEHSVSLEERQSVMNFLEAQQLDVKQKLAELQNMDYGGKDLST